MTQPVRKVWGWATYPHSWRDDETVEVKEAFYIRLADISAIRLHIPNGDDVTRRKAHGYDLQPMIYLRCGLKIRTDTNTAKTIAKSLGSED